VVLSQSPLTGEKIEASDVPSVLENLGIELTDKELEELMKTLPFNGKSMEASCEVEFRSSKFHF
jgi:hypothetical protein